MTDQVNVVIVHGLWMTGMESVLMRRQIATHTGWQPARFRYRSVVDSVAASASRLGRFIDALPPGPVHIVAHSLGGLVTHALLHGRGIDRPGRVVLLCSPVQGSMVAQRLSALPGGRKILGKCVAETLLTQARREWETDREVGVIAGTASVGLGIFLGGITRPNDGTVAVAETMLPGATDSIELPVSHSSALFSDAVAGQIAHFLDHGRFRH